MFSREWRRVAVLAVIWIALLLVFAPIYRIQKATNSAPESDGRNRTLYKFTISASFWTEINIQIVFIWNRVAEHYGDPFAVPELAR